MYLYLSSVSCYHISLNGTSDILTSILSRPISFRKTFRASHCKLGLDVGPTIIPVIKLTGIGSSLYGISDPFLTLTFGSSILSHFLSQGKISAFDNISSESSISKFQILFYFYVNKCFIFPDIDKQKRL